MKKLLAILLLSVASIFSPVFPQDITGAGTSGDPYILYNADDVDSIRYLGGMTAYYKLNNNIDMSSYANWVPIPSTSATVTGQLDMNYKTISNLTITHTFAASGSDSVGFFATLVPPSANSIPRLKNGQFLDCTMNLSGAMVSGNTSGFGLIAGWTEGAPTSPSAATIDSIIVRNLVININFTSGSSIIGGYSFGGVFGHAKSSYNAWVNRVAIIDINITATMVDHTHISAGFDKDGIGGICGYGWIKIYNSSVTGKISVTGATAQTRSTRVGGFVGRTRRNAAGSSTITQDSYVRMTKLSNVNGGVGGFFGENDGSPNPFINCYALIDTLLSPNSGANDFDGTWLGVISESNSTFTDCFVDTQYVKKDTTEAGAYDKTIAGYTEGHAGTDLALLTTAQALTQATYTDSSWDFTDIWFMSAEVNDGYPAHFWSQTQAVGPTLIYPDSMVYYFREDSVITIEWDGGTDTTTFNWLYYSVNQGNNWILIDSVAYADTTYDWTIPDAPTTQGKIKIQRDGTVALNQADSSEVNFYILTNSFIDFLYPIQVPELSLFSGDTVHVSFESQFVTNVFLYWSSDSLTWHFIDTVVVDTTNGFFQDTTTYIWTLPPTITGPTIYGRAEEENDTTLYYFERSYVYHGAGYPHGAFICQTSTGGKHVYAKYRYDPSCGWSSPIQGWDIRLLDDDGLTHSYVHNHFEWPYTLADYDTPDPVYLDSVATDLNDFYDYGATLSYQGRTYYFVDSLLLCDDEINNIDSILVVNLADMFTGVYGWTSGHMTMQLYHVQRSKISGQYLPADTTFENLNDWWFEPRIIIGADSHAYPDRTVSIVALPYPNNADPATEDETFYINAKVGRYFFRGIHPKAEKR